MDGKTSELLRGVSLFENLDGEDIEKLAGLAFEQTYGKDEVVLQQEEPGDALYVILDGRVNVVLYGEDGKEVILSTLRAGDFFGEMALLDGGPRSASVVALDESRVVKIARASFLQLLQEHPEMSLRILEAMSRRLRMADGKIGSLAMMDVYGRVARAIRDLADQEGKQAGSNVVIEQRRTHQELANMAGTSRETVSRVVGDFVRSGLMTLDGKRMILHGEFLEGVD